MRLSLDARAQLLLRRLPRTTWFTVLEIVLLSVLAVQCARLVWAIATPVGPIGDWRSDAGVPSLSAPDMALFETFDPFFRLEGNARVVVTDLDLSLFGVRQDQASGRGSAIIALPNGEQDSFLVGDELMPGVTLESVGFDFVTISRNSASEQIFLDQSGGASPPARSAARPARNNAARPGAAPGGSAAAQSRRPAVETVTPAALAAGTQISPRREGNRLTGIVLQPSGDSAAALNAAGFQPGDVIVSINGERIQDMGQAVSFARNLGAGDGFVQVERNGETVSFRARVGE
ncbi:type II secretory pathway component PulC [Parasphingopyxis algicola]|uniref:type II secretion system protein N n=1 Tax=Parasphingopyxis algicola TaxID=2026624 RepID=UPI0015A0D8D0|nr:type II secretion system protein N [Parasphingopyxis algicola]QLC23880.1 type II secretory pathway component PulC [Parasphingopyxis algicola]